MDESPIVVIAPTYRIATHWARENDINPRRIVYVSGPHNVHQIQGLKEPVYTWIHSNDPHLRVKEGWRITDALMAARARHWEEVTENG